MVRSSDLAKLWKPNLSGIELFEARLHRHRFGKHFHEAYTIGFNESGQGYSRHQGVNQVLIPGNFNLINPGEMHTGQVASPDGWTFRNIYIELPLMEQAIEQLEWLGKGQPYFNAPIFNHRSLASLFYSLFESLASSTDLLKQQSLLLELLSQLFQVNGEKSFSLRPAKSESRTVMQVRTYLEEYYSKIISLDELAQLVNLSPYYLIRCFRQQIGCAPHQYQRHCQLLQVKQALQRQEESLAAIATTHGFYDQSHLNRAFKQTYGVTPGNYQKDNSVQYG
ncbi:MAG: AraC family transcriptional regulator [Cyanobacteria bacterium P01_D01_bin.156]